MVTYKRPQMIATLLTNYKFLTYEVNVGIESLYLFRKFFMQLRQRRWNVQKKFMKLKREKAEKLKKRLVLSVVNVISSTQVKQSCFFCKGGFLIDITG